MIEEISCSIKDIVCINILIGGIIGYIMMQYYITFQLSNERNKLGIREIRKCNNIIFNLNKVSISSTIMDRLIR